jgi:hypothetical protein
MFRENREKSNKRAEVLEENMTSQTKKLEENMNRKFQEYNENWRACLLYTSANAVIYESDRE